MVDLKKLKEIGRAKGIQNLDQMEKDYFQELILLSISRNNEAGLIFKGGTCIYKLFSLDRFSEDLDFDGIPDRSFRTRVDYSSENMGMTPGSQQTITSVGVLV